MRADEAPPSKIDQHNTAQEEEVTQHYKDATEDPDWTSSSGSSNGDEDEDDDHDQGQEVPVDVGIDSDNHDEDQQEQKPDTAPRSTPLKFPKPEKSRDLQARIAEFLPQLKASNEQLKDQDAKSYQVDNVPDNNNGTPFIEMELGLGVLTERTSKGSDIQVSPLASEKTEIGIDSTIGEEGGKTQTKTQTKRPVIEEL